MNYIKVTEKLAADYGLRPWIKHSPWARRLNSDVYVCTFVSINGLDHKEYLDVELPREAFTRYSFAPALSEQLQAWKKKRAPRLPEEPTPPEWGEECL